jgi:hypothetical protein
MSTPAIGSSSQSLQTYFETRKSDMQQLGKDLKSGDMSAAENDFNTITALGKNGPFANGNAFINTQRQEDFTSIGQSLQSGNIGDADQSFESLQATWRHEPSSGGTSDPTTTATTTPTSTGLSVSA